MNNNIEINQDFLEMDQAFIFFLERNHFSYKFNKQQQQPGFSELTFNDSVPEEFKISPATFQNDFFTDCSFGEGEHIEYLEEDIKEQQKYLLHHSPQKQVDDQSCRIIQRRIDKQIRFDLFYFCLLEECKNKKQIQKKRIAKTQEKHHRSIISLFVLFKLVLIEKKGEINLNALRQRVQQRIMKKYEKIAVGYGHLLKNQLDIIFKAMTNFLQRRQRQAIQIVYQSRQMNKSSINKMQKCKSIIQGIRRLD